MDNFFKYLPFVKNDLRFGVFVHNCGFAKVLPFSIYPDPGHPTHHHFTFEKGRVLKEYQMLYITNGEGVFESDSAGRLEIREGSILFLFPGEWHRYKPDEQTGWSEYWMGFSGPFADHLFVNNFIRKSKPVINIGYNEEIVKLFQQVFSLMKDESFGFQYLVAGLSLNLLGHVLFLQTRKNMKSGYIEKIITRSKLIMAEMAGTEITGEDIARQLHISYSWFRKLFKSYTSFSPKEYLLEIRINKTKQALLSTTKSIKEIALENGFNSQYHFSKIFKSKTGSSPKDFRESSWIRGNGTD